MIIKKGLLASLLVFLSSCASSFDCEEGFAPNFGPNGAEYCVPEFEVGLLNNFTLGNTYFHQKFGIIIRKESAWYNTANKVVKL